MKIAKYCIISICLAAITAGCAPTRVSTPAPRQQDQGYNNTGRQITEQPIRSQPSSDNNLPVKDMPQPIQLPVIDQGTGQPSGNTVLPPIDYVNDRIFEYGRKLDRWNELDKQSVVQNLTPEQTEAMVRCFRDLKKVLNNYQRLHDAILQRNILSESDLFSAGDAMELQKMDIAFLESTCGRMLADSDDQAVGWQERQKEADLSQVETLIERYSSSKEYNDVVQVWLQIPPYQVARVGLRTRLLYGNALMYLDQKEKAAEVYQQIVDQMSVSKEQPTDILSLLKMLADLYTASGNYPAAKTQYEQISTDYLNIGKIDERAK